MTNWDLSSEPRECKRAVSSKRQGVPARDRIIGVSGLADNRAVGPE